MTLNKEKNNRRILALGLFGALIFGCLYIFFTKAHPLYIHDLDDWFYLYVFRRPYPTAAEMNPVKVLPETWMPLTAYLGAYWIYPFTGDYVEALSMAFALVLSGMITAYTLGAMALLRRQFQVRSLVTEILLGSIFLLAHFLPFLIGEENNSHVFQSLNVTCIFNYTLPALLNLLLCTYFFDQENQWKDLSSLKWGFLLLGLYLAIFSSLFHSIVLMSLFGIQLLFALIQGVCGNVREKKPWLSWPFIRDYLRVHYPKLLALAVWFVSMLFQLGGRAEDISGAMDLGSIFYAFLELILWGLNPQFKLAVIVINLAALGLGAYRFFRYRESGFLVQMAKLLGCMALILVYLALVTGKLSPSYFVRPDVTIDWMSLLILMTLFSLAYLLQKFPRSVAVLPILVYMLLFFTVFNDVSFANYNASGLPSSVVKAIDDDIIAQVTAAQEAGLPEVEVYIPESLCYGWPLDVPLMSRRIPDALYCHGIIDYPIAVTVVPSPEKDAQFMLK